MVQVLFAIAMIGVAIAFGIESSSYRATAARTPMLLSWVVGLLALGMLIEAVLKYRKAQDAVEAVPLAPETPIHASDARAGGSLPRALAFLALTVIYTISFRWVGFVPGSIVFLGAAMLLFRATRPLFVLVTIVAALGIIYAVFVAFLRLPVPLWPEF